MGKTIRRKDIKGDGGYYEWKNEVRNDPKASERYVHSDMPYRNGRWKSISPVKDEGNMHRRAETRALSKKVLQVDDVEELDTTHKCQKVKYSDPWDWD